MEVIDIAEEYPDTRAPMILFEYAMQVFAQAKNACLLSI